MRISFHGAAREVTGSSHLLDVSGKRILLDCGMIQGGRDRHERNREPFTYCAETLDQVILSHAHIDHSGRLPLLVKRGFRGPIRCTEATADLLQILLSDSGRIQEEDARWKIKRLKKQKKDYSWVEPLFTEEEALKVMDHLQPTRFDESFDILGAGSGRFVKAGHILGAAIMELNFKTAAGERTVVFSGDLGVEGARLMPPPTTLDSPDYLIMESTYGDRQRKGDEDRTEALFRLVDRTLRRRGKVVIPSFAVGRTQEVLARLNDLVESGRLSNAKVYVDSPMAVNATNVFTQHPLSYGERAQELLRAGDAPLDFPGLKLVTDVEESKALNHSDEPCVIISASGMATAGRIKHHLAHNISDSRATIIFVGYQARESLGQVIQRGTTPVRIFGDWFPVRADIETIEGFSAHADQEELLGWFDGLDGTPRRTFLVHGEEDACERLAGRIEREFRAPVTVPHRDQFFDLD